MSAAIPPAERMLDLLKVIRDGDPADPIRLGFGNPHALVAVAGHNIGTRALDAENLVIQAARLIRAAELLSEGGE